MPRYPLPPIAGLLLACAALSCSEPAGPAVGPGKWDGWDSWTMDFYAQISSKYGGESCGPGSTLYCKTWYPTSGHFTGTLHRKGGSLVLSLPSGDFTTTQWVYQDSLNIAAKVDAYCTTYGLLIPIPATGDTLGASISGRYVHSTDCHGAGTMGVFSGKR